MAVSIFVFSASSISAQCGGASGNVKGDGTKNYNQQGIENKIPDLTDKQKEEIKVIRTAQLKDSQSIKDQMSIKRAELKALQNVENPDLAAINKKIEERSALRTSLEKKSAAYRQDVRALLTDDQKVYFDKSRNKGQHKAHNCGSKTGKGCGSKQKAKAGCK